MNETEFKKIIEQIRNNQIKELDFSHERLNKTQQLQLAQSMKSAELTSINLSSQEEIELELISSLAEVKGLSDIKLNFSKIGYNQLCFLFLTTLLSLNSLSLRFNDLNDNCLELFADLNTKDIPSSCIFLLDDTQYDFFGITCNESGIKLEDFLKTPLILEKKNKIELERKQARQNLQQKRQKKDFILSLLDPKCKINDVEENKDLDNSEKQLAVMAIQLRKIKTSLITTNDEVTVLENAPLLATQRELLLENFAKLFNKKFEADCNKNQLAKRLEPNSRIAPTYCSPTLSVGTCNIL